MEIGRSQTQAKVLVVGDELGAEGSRLSPQQAARLAQDFAAFAADFARTGAYR